jgi:hypoxanthine phosphoribosyltransferase
MHPDLQELLISAAEINAAIQEMGARLTTDYGGRDLFLVGILKGAVPFLADLMRTIDLPLAYDLMAVSSYGNAASSSGTVRILKDLDQDIEGRDVLVVEDIVDTGLTLQYLLDALQARKPTSLRVCTLLDKPERRQVAIEPDYKGFTIPNVFVVGFGLDYAEKYRNLPYIGVLKPEIYQNEK